MLLLLCCLLMRVANPPQVSRQLDAPFEFSFQVRFQSEAFVKVFLRFALVSEKHPYQTAIEISPGDSLDRVRSRD